MLLPVGPETGVLLCTATGAAFESLSDFGVNFRGAWGFYVIQLFVRLKAHSREAVK